jgi:AAA15 family ATPase/GTPase
MLIRFGVENHLSIADRQELSLVASPLKDQTVALIQFPKVDVELLPAAIIYGANASGKSNFISAMAYLQQSVRFSHERGSPSGGLPRSPFLLDSRMRSAPSKFDVDFVLDGVRYQYGFSANDEIYLDEWLYAFPAGKRQTWFVREPTKENIYFGKNLKGSTRTIEALMRKNSLFLSVAAQNAHEQLNPIFQSLTNFRFKIGTQDQAITAAAAFPEGECDRRIIEFLKNADTGITAYRFEDSESSKDSPASLFGAELEALLKKHIPDLDKIRPDPFARKRISLGHLGSGEQEIFFDLRYESNGTLRLLTLLKSVFEALDQGLVVVIDELDASLHTYLAEDILSLFNSNTTNQNGAQLIATTRDTNLLSRRLMRRDQIWFTEKDNKGATALYPLTDIRTRNTDNIEKGYLEGRFGAIPCKYPPAEPGALV